MLKNKKSQDDLKKNPHDKVADSIIKSFVSRKEVCIFKLKMNLIYLMKTLKLPEMTWTELKHQIYKIS